MTTEITSIFVQHPRAEDVSSPSSDYQRALYIGKVAIIVGGFGRSSESLRAEAAAMTALANAATELAHWCENIAGDLEETCGGCGSVRSSNRCPDCVKADVREDRAIEAQS